MAARFYIPTTLSEDSNLNLFILTLKLYIGVNSLLEALNLLGSQSCRERISILPVKLGPYKSQNRFQGISGGGAFGVWVPQRKSSPGSSSEGLSRDAVYS